MTKNIIHARVRGKSSLLAMGVGERFWKALLLILLLWLTVAWAVAD